SKWNETVQQSVRDLAKSSDRGKGKGIALEPLAPKVDGKGIAYKYVTVVVDGTRRVAELTIRAPDGAEPKSPAEFEQVGGNAWALRAFRELDDALLRLRLNHLDIATVVLRAQGDAAKVLEVDRTLHEHRSHWLVREILGNMRRVLKRLDMTSRTLYAF